MTRNIRISAVSLTLGHETVIGNYLSSGARQWCQVNHSHDLGGSKKSANDPEQLRVSGA